MVFAHRILMFQVSKGDTKLFMAKTTAYNQWLSSDGIPELTKLELTSTPLDMDILILEAIDSGAALTGTGAVLTDTAAARYFLVQTRN